MTGIQPPFVQSQMRRQKRSWANKVTPNSLLVDYIVIYFVNLIIN
jgi:hypothetical protein